MVVEWLLLLLRLPLSHLLLALRLDGNALELSNLLFEGILFRRARVRMTELCLELLHTVATSTTLSRRR
jgi:hypothetical protein